MDIVCRCKSPFSEAGAVSVVCVTLVGRTMGLSNSPPYLWVKGVSATEDP